MMPYFCNRFITKASVSVWPALNAHLYPSSLVVPIKGFQRSVTTIPPKSLINLQGNPLIADHENRIMIDQSRCIHSSPSRSGVLDSFNDLFRRDGYIESDLVELAHHLYREVSYGTDTLHFFKVLGMDDTLFSWFRILILQMWFVYVRLGSEGEPGEICRKHLSNIMWEDVYIRIKMLNRKAKDKNADINQLRTQQISFVLFLDEGLMGTDAELANAVWNNLLANKKPEYMEDDTFTDLNHIQDFQCDPRVVELMVSYVRKMVHKMDQMPTEEFMKNPKIDWIKPKL